jgi:signal transduction histidine kinase
MSTWRRGWKALQASLFLKLMLIMALAAFALNAAYAEAFRRARLESLTRGAELRVKDHAGYVFKDLGDPPRRDRALELAAQGLWKFRFIPDPGTTLPAWSIPDSVPLPEELRYGVGGPDWGFQRGGVYALRRVQGGRLLLYSEPWRGVGLAWSWRLGLGALSLGILFLAWAAIRWLLLPVRWLDQGMARVAAGELGHRIPTRQRDELGRLAEQFNAMSARVQAMLEQRRQLLLDVGHELRTPLTRLKLGLEALPAGPERASLAEDVEALETLVEELLEGARLEAGQDGLRLELLDLAALIRELSGEFAGLPPGLTLRLPERLILRADGARLQRLLHNLLSNAFSHGLPATAPVELSLETAEGRVRLCVRDHGPGVPVEDLARLATPFFRTDRSRSRGSGGGVGLGLYLCRRIAQAHGAAFKLEPALRRGLKVCVELPLAERDGTV